LSEVLYSYRGKEGSALHDGTGKRPDKTKRASKKGVGLSMKGAERTLGKKTSRGEGPLLPGRRRNTSADRGVAKGRSLRLAVSVPTKRKKKKSTRMLSQKTPPFLILLGNRDSDD